MAGKSEEEVFSTARRKRLSLLKTPLSVTRYSPYTKTPRTGRSTILPKHCARENVEVFTPNASTFVNNHLSDQLKTPLRNGEVCEITNEITSIVRKTWRVHCCSPFHKLCYKNLKQYGKLLSSSLQAETTKESKFVEEHFSGKLVARFSVLKDLVLYNTDPRGLQIELVDNTSNSKIEKRLSLSTIVLCSIGRDIDENMSDDAFKTHFVSLPVCLAKGTVALTRYVLSWLERQFDCRITPMVFSPSELSWYSSLWAGTVPKESEHLLELCYKVPTGIRGLRQITLSVNASDARELWECMHPSDSDIFNEEESVFFMHSLESHFYHHFKISLGSMSLSRIANSLVFIGGEGRLKILHAGYVRHVLQQITQAAAEREILARL